MTVAAMLARRQLRLAALTALQGAALQVDGVDVTLHSPGDWSVPPANLPALRIAAPSERKEGQARGVPNFDTRVVLEIEGRVQGAVDTDAQDAMEALGYAVECALLTNWGLLSLASVGSVEVETSVESKGRTHIAGFAMHLHLDLFERFDPVEQAPASLQPVAVPLQSIGLHADLTAPYDPNGIYADTLFPQAALPAPRTSGPDGRDEGALDISLPQ